MDIIEQKITKIAREAEKLVLLPAFTSFCLISASSGCRQRRGLRRSSAYRQDRCRMPALGVVCAAGGEDQRRWQDDGVKRIKVYQKIAAAKRTSPRQFFWLERCLLCGADGVVRGGGVSVRLPQPHRESAAVSTVSSGTARFFVKSPSRHIFFIHTFSVTETAVFCQERLRLSFF